MGFGEESLDDDEWLPLDTGRSAPAQTWQHPSEVGAATRGHADRRRATLIASGVLIGGLGLLLTSLVMGSTSAGPLEAVEGTDTTLPGAVATVIYTDESDRPVALPGLLVDDAGHLLIPLGGSDGLLSDQQQPPAMWVTLHGGGERPTELVGVDESAGIAVVRAPGPIGVAVAAGVPRSGDELAVIASGTSSPSLSGWAEVATTPARGGIELLGGSPGVNDPGFAVAPLEGDIPAGALLFDRRGDFAGLMVDPGPSAASATATATPRVVRAPQALDAARAMILAAD